MVAGTVESAPAEQPWRRPLTKTLPQKEKRRETSSRRRRWVMVGVSKRRHAQIRPKWLMPGKQFATNENIGVQHGGLHARMLKCRESRWRPHPESNRGARICNPLRHHSAIGPQEKGPLAALRGGDNRPFITFHRRSMSRRSCALRGRAVMLEGAYRSSDSETAISRWTST